MKLLVLGDFQGNFPDKLKQKLKKEEFDLILGVGDYGGISDWRPWVMADLKNSREGKGRISPEKYFGKKKFKKIIEKDINAAKKVFETINNFNKPVMLVFGNGDDGWYKYPFIKSYPSVKKSLSNFLKRIKNVNYINYKNKKFKNIEFVGFGGYMDIEAYLDKNVFPDSAEKKKYFTRLKRLTDSRKNMFSRLKKSKGEKIFVLHYPPLGVFDIIKDKKDNPMNGKSAGVRFFKEAIVKYKPKLVVCGHMHEYQGSKKIGKTLVVNPGDAEKSRYAIIDYPSLKVKIAR